MAQRTDATLNGDQNHKASEKLCEAVRVGAHAGGGAGAREGVQSLQPGVQAAARTGALEAVEALTQRSWVGEKLELYGALEGMKQSREDPAARFLHFRAFFQLIMKHGAHPWAQKLIKMLKDAKNDPSSARDFVKEYQQDYLDKNFHAQDQANQIEAYQPTHKSTGRLSCIDTQLNDIAAWVAQPQAVLPPPPTRPCCTRETITRQANDITEKINSIHVLRTQLSAKEASILNLETQLQNLKTELSEKDNRLSTEEASIQNLKTQLDAKEASIQNLEAQLDEKEASSRGVKRRHDSSDSSSDSRVVVG